MLAIIAKYYSIPFIVAAPTSSIDYDLKEGKDIVIEERSSSEVKCVEGKPIANAGDVNNHTLNITKVQIAADAISVWNPAFDITPASLITAIVTENGVCLPKDDHAFNLKQGN